MIYTKIIQNSGKAKKIDLTGKESIRAKEIELNIKFGYDRHLLEQETTTETTSKAEHLAEEDFENDYLEVQSPSGDKAPNAEIIEDEELDGIDQTENKLVNISDKSQLFFILCGSADIVDLISFTIFYQMNGGIYSLIPYLLTLIFITFPTSIYEVALAQFSSLPLFSIFRQMAPILGGVPFMIMYFRLIYLAHVALRPKLYSFSYSLLHTVLMGDKAWMDCTQYASDAHCFNPALNCRINEHQVYGKCQPNVGQSVYLKKTSAIASKYIQIENEQYNLFSGTQFASLAMDLDASTLLMGSFLYFSVIGLVFYLGFRTISRLSFFLMISPIIGILPVVFSLNFDNEIYEMIEKQNDISKLMNWQTYFWAFSEALKTSQIFQGTLSTLACKRDFHHNFFKDMVINTLFGAAWRIFYVLTMLPVYYKCQGFIYPAHPFPIDKFTERNKMIDLLLTGLPYLVVKNWNWIGIAMHFATINMAIFGKTIVTLEIMKTSVYKLFPKLHYSNRLIIQVIIVIFFISSFMTYQWYNVELVGSNHSSYSIFNYKFTFGVTSFVHITTVYMMIGVRFIYGEQRLYVNCLTMLRKHDRTYQIFSYLRNYFLLTWRLAPFFMVINFFVIATRILTIYEFLNFQYTFAVGFPILYSLWKLTRGYVKFDNLQLLTSCHLWRPMHWINYRESREAERKYGFNNE